MQERVGMRSQTKRIRRPLAGDEIESDSVVQPIRRQNFEKVAEMNQLNRIRDSLKDFTLEERRKEAKKPLYLVRYE